MNPRPDDTHAQALTVGEMQPLAGPCALLGESPSWDPDQAYLLWADCARGILYRFRPADQTTHATPTVPHLGCVVPTDLPDTVVVGAAAGMTGVHLSTGRRTPVAHLDVAPGAGINDGKADTAGRIIVGTRSSTGREHTGQLYALPAGGPLVLLRDGLRVSNGLAWSPDGRWLYHIDTPTRRITASTYQPDTPDWDHPARWPASHGPTA